AVEPADCRENCKYRGALYEIAMAFVETLGNDIKPKFLTIEWDEQFLNKDGMIVREDSYTPELLASGKCDFYASYLARLPWRINKLDFVVLTPNRIMVMVNKSKQAEFKIPADLCGKVAAVLKASTFTTWLEEQNKGMCVAKPIQIKLLAGVEEGVKLVDAGSIDFTMLDTTDAIWRTRHQVKNTVAAFVVGPMDEGSWAFCKEDKDLQAAVQKFFDTQRADKNSALNQIWKKYYGMTLIDFIELITWIK
ncbi:MAG: transporter substrate-binding domain-containing protein, partial [Nitrososphaera sp.]|nr:transporter substrate-binding domain-containing protein [Nitrososphaera sp.]